jgi:acetate kinase
MGSLCVVLNAGSSSLKFQVFDAADEAGLYRGQADRLSGQVAGEPAHFLVKDSKGTEVYQTQWQPGADQGHEEALARLVSWTRQTLAGNRLVGVGHRVVHGGQDFAGPVLIDDGVLARLEKLDPLAPLHQPHNLRPIRIIRKLLPDVAQVACFDTAFHRSQPELAQLFALPRAMTERGVRRYGFHGLSYDYVASIMGRYDKVLATGRTIIAHLGNGASLCALHGGKSIASTMGFSALDGLMMGTRCGALDAAVVFYMLREMKLSAETAEQELYTKSGLLGVSGISGDMRTLRSLAATDPSARQAIDLYVYRIVREVGSLVAALGGIDGLVFTAGVGENDAATRAEVLAGLSFLGLALDSTANAAGGPRISRGSGPQAFVIATNEELVIARQMKAVTGSIDRLNP